MHFLENNFPQESLYLDISFFVAPRTMSSKNIPETFICARFKITRETTTRTRAGNNNYIFSCITATMLAKVSLKSEGRLRLTLVTRGNVKSRDEGV